MAGFGVFLFSILVSLSAFASSRALVSEEVQSYVLLSTYNSISDSATYTAWDYYRQVCHQTLVGLDDDVRIPVESVFEKLQSTVFGQQLFKINLCFVDAAATDIQERTIYIDAAFISRLVRSLSPEKREAVLAVFIGHEIGHYLYEEILISRRNAATALGHSASWFDTASSANADAVKTRHLIHGEIDVIGFNLAERAGFNVYSARNVLDDVESVLQGVTIPGKSIRQSVIDSYLNP